jgi:hypothetical protein
MRQPPAIAHEFFLEGLDFVVRLKQHPLDPVDFPAFDKL